MKTTTSPQNQNLSRSSSLRSLIKCITGLTLLAVPIADGASVYQANYDLVDWSGLGPNGGTATIPFFLASGPDINGGEPIYNTYSFPGLTNGYMLDIGPSLTPLHPGWITMTVGDGDGWDLGEPTSSTLNWEVGMPTIPVGYEIVAEIISIGTGTIGTSSGNDYRWNMTAVPDGNAVFSGETLRYDFNVVGSGDPDATGLYETVFFNLHQITFDTIPEPTTSLLLGIAGLFVMRRRRTA